MLLLLDEPSLTHPYEKTLKLKIKSSKLFCFCWWWTGTNSQSSTSKALTWIRCKLGKQYLVKKFTLPWESNPGPFSNPGRCGNPSSVCWVKKIDIIPVLGVVVFHLCTVNNQQYLRLNTMCEKRDGHGRRVYIFRLGD